LEIIFNLILQFFLSPIFLLLFSYLGWFIKLIFFLWFNAPSFFSIGFDPFFFIIFLDWFFYHLILSWFEIGFFDWAHVWEFMGYNFERLIWV
jgi:hypothetical protein